MSEFKPGSPPNSNVPANVYSVSQLNFDTRELLEDHFGSIWIRGELSNLAKPASGHVYFSLKDARAQIRCAMFRTRHRGMSFIPEDGMDVLVRANVSLYEARGDFQLIVDFMEQAGDGLLRRQFELLKQKLAEEGLFDDAHKQYLPDFPRQIGVLTSPSGAAIRDILSVLKRRFPSIPVLIYPIPVQGNDAPAKIIAMINKAEQRRDCDVLIVARGGGSLEDLWAFNDERLARAIYACEIPIVTGIGHEIDFTIADFVADVRAPTPSVAAEMVTPNRDEFKTAISRLQSRLVAKMRNNIAHAHLYAESLQKRLQHPHRRILMLAQHCDEFEKRLFLASKNMLRHRHASVHSYIARLIQRSPLQIVRSKTHKSQLLHQRLIHQMQQLISKSDTRLSYAARTLDNISPLKSLSRGYAIIHNRENGQIVRNSKDLSVGDEVKAIVHKGSFTAKVTTINSTDKLINQK